MNKRNGFTLFELLVSISIIGVLTAVVAFSFSAAQKKARDARRISDMNTIQKAAEQYYAANSYSYPTSATMPWTGADGGSIMANYPVDPKNSGGYVYYNTSFAVGGYCVCALLENTSGGNSSTTGCAFVNGGAYYCVQNQQ